MSTPVSASASPVVPKKSGSALASHVVPKKSGTPLKRIVGKYTPPSKTKSKELKPSIEHDIYGYHVKGDLTAFSIEKPNGACAFLNKMEKSSSNLASNDKIMLIQFANHVNADGVIQTAAQGSKYNRKILVCAKIGDDEDDKNTSMKRQGEAIAGEFQTNTPPYTDGKIVGRTNIASFAYCKNDGEEYLNKIVGDKSASEVVARLYEPYIADGSFYEQAKDIIAIYFEEVDAGEMTKKITLAHEKMLK